MTGAVQRLRAIEADWMAKATQSAIDAAREVISENDINGRAMIGSLNELEWGWICSAAIFAWIKTKSQQAVAEGIGYDQAIRSMPGSFPQPWEAGAVESVLPALSDVKGIDWETPISELPKRQMVLLAWHMHGLVERALLGRDEGAPDKLTQTSQAVIERELRARAGGPLLARGELNDDDVPF